MDVIKFIRLWNITKSLLGGDSCHHAIVFDLLYMKLLHNNYVMFILLFAGYGQSLSLNGRITLIQHEVI